MKQDRQVMLPLGPLPVEMELVPGDECYHLRIVGQVRCICGRVIGTNPLKTRKKQAGWGRVPQNQRCSQCTKRFEKMKDQARSH